MNCRRFIEQLPDFIDGTLSKTSISAMQRHMKECSSCREEYETQLEVARALGSLKMHTPPPELISGVMQKVTAHKHVSRRTVLLRTLSGIAAAALVVFGLAALMDNHSLAGLDKAAGSDTALSAQTEVKAPSAHNAASAFTDGAASAPIADAEESSAEPEEAFTDDMAGQLTEPASIEEGKYYYHRFLTTGEDLPPIVLRTAELIFDSAQPDDAAMWQARVEAEGGHIEEVNYTPANTQLIVFLPRMADETYYEELWETEIDWLTTDMTQIYYEGIGSLDAYELSQEEYAVRSDELGAIYDQSYYDVITIILNY